MFTSKHPVAEFTTHGKDASEKSLLDQHLEFAQTGKPEFVLDGAVLHSGITTELAEPDGFVETGCGGLFAVNGFSGIS